MIVKTIDSKSILSEQKGGFLSSKPYPFTHTLSPYTGCGFGNSLCGQYCYAPSLPSWQHSDMNKDGHKWGDIVTVKQNAADILNNSLRSMKRRDHLRIFMSPATDPYQPIEAKQRITRALLEVFSRYDDLDLLVIQTRSPLVVQDLELIAKIPYAWLSMTVETDDQAFITANGGGPALRARLEAVMAARDAGIKTQIAVSPCLPHSDLFIDTLRETHADRFIVDDFIEGDGSRGNRTAQSDWGQTADYDWRDSDPARHLYDMLIASGEDVGWSSSGFCGIPERKQSVIPTLF